MTTEYFETVEDIKKHIVAAGFHITAVARMKSSSGVHNLFDVNDTFRCEASCWTGYWTTKYNTLSYDDFIVWVTPKLLKFIIDDTPGDTYVGLGGWYDIRKISARQKELGILQ